MRLAGIFLSILLSCVFVVGQNQIGVQVADIYKKADPCTDFFEYSNGAWRASNPIPASMDRWSRRWQAGETNKEKLPASSTMPPPRPASPREASTS